MNSYLYSASSLINNIGQGWNFFSMLGLKALHIGQLELPEVSEDFTLEVKRGVDTVEGTLPDGRVVRLYNVGASELPNLEKRAMSILNVHLCNHHAVPFLAHSLSLDIVGHFQVKEMYSGGIIGETSGAMAVLYPSYNEATTVTMYTIIEVLNYGFDVCQSNEVL